MVKRAKVIAFSIGLCVILSAYLFMRRGYYDLYIANKVVAGVALLLLCAVLLLGTLGRLYSFFDKYLMYRKDLGLLSFAYAATHSVVSLFFLRSHFPPERFLAFPPSFIFGLSSMMVLTLLFIFSIEALVARLDRKKWWHLQNWGVRIGGILVLLHILTMKWSGWSNWYANGGSAELMRPFLPPAGLLVTSVGAYVFVVRVVEYILVTHAKKLVFVCTLIYAAFLVATFYTGMIRKTDKKLDWFTCTHIPYSLVMEKFPGECITPWGEHVMQNIRE